MRKIIYSDTELIDGILEQDGRIIQEFYSYVFAKVRMDVRRFSPRLEDAEDVMHETFMIVYKKLLDGEYQAQGKFVAYFIRIAKYVCLNMFRRKKRITVDSGGTYTSSTEEMDWDMEQLLEEKRRFQIILDCIKQLSYQCQEILNRYYLKNEKLKDIGADMRYKDGGIGAIKYRCMSRLRKLVAEIINRNDD